MPSVFVYEFLTAGGCFSLGSEPPAGSLLLEGAAMRDALAADFAACAFIDEVHLLHDVRLPAPRIMKQRLHRVTSAAEESRLFQQLASAAERTIIIAPEFGGCLGLRANWATAAGAAVLSPSAEFIQLAANKQQTAEHLHDAGIRVSEGISWSGSTAPAGAHSLFPAVLKPLDGAGSTNVRYFANCRDFATVDLTVEPAWRLERYQPGIAASVAYLAGNGGVIFLPACAQLLSIDGTFQYLGGTTPLPALLSSRASALAQQVQQALPQASGFVGIDIVLGSADNGAEDVVIEVNPRLTTSYLGLRRACEQNLAEVMWRLSQGECPRLTFRNETIHFSPYPANDAT